MLGTRYVTRTVVATWLGTAVALLAQGCATSEPPRVGHDQSYEERAETQVQGELSVTVGLPTAAEARAIYGVDLAEEHIQLVWVEIQNETDLPYWFLISGLDPNYFAASKPPSRFAAPGLKPIKRWMNDSTSFSSEIR